MRLPVILAALAFLASLPPPAAACSYAQPPAYGRLAWDQPGEIVADMEWAVGALDLATGNATRWTWGIPGASWAASPDGRYLVHSHGGERPLPRWHTDSCGPYFGAVEIADLANGTKAKLLDGAATALAAGPGAVAIAHPSYADGVLVYSWGEWDAPRRLSARASDVSTTPAMFDHPLFPEGVRRLVFSPDGARLAMASRDNVAVRNVADGGAAPDGATHVGTGTLAALAWSPEGAHLAAAGSPTPHRFADLRVLLADGLTGVAHHSDTAAIRDLAWGPRGLALLLEDRPPYDGQPRTIVRVFPHAPNLTASLAADVANTTAHGLAWSPDGERLAVSVHDGLRIFDTDLQETARYAADRDPAGPLLDRPAHGEAPGLLERLVPAPAVGLAAAVAIAAVALRRSRG